ncbi:RNA-binding protein [Actinosynnema sp. NPDC050436]|uniref:RNA recognition motif domain-containing protein n=1 Tax=Actinosynnema sp. NPDC050436 TaxID=3155659 RepID=UPI0033CBEB06
MAIKLYVGNLATETTDEGLRNAFVQYGEVVDVAVERDAETGGSRGFGYVEMASRAKADVAIAELNGHHLQGRPLAVREHRARPGR